MKWAMSIAVSLGCNCFKVLRSQSVTSKEKRGGRNLRSVKITKKEYFQNSHFQPKTLGINELHQKSSVKRPPEAHFPIDFFINPLKICLLPDFHQILTLFFFTIPEPPNLGYARLVILWERAISLSRYCCLSPLIYYTIDRGRGSKSLIKIPGISIEFIIDNMSESNLKELVGVDFVRTLERLNNDKVDLAHLKQIATSLFGDNNSSTIKNTESRNTLIDCLPLDKAKELCKNLSIPLQGNIYTSLKDVELVDSKTENTMCSFFGIVEDLVARQTYSPSSSEIKPTYGLFNHQRDVALKTLSALENYPNKAVVHMPTGSGKTRTAMHIIAQHMKSHGPTLICWLANSAELLDQAAEDFEKSWSVLGDRKVNIYRFWGDHQLDLETVQDGLLVAGLSKMHAAYKRNQNILMCLGDRTSLTVVDEAHQSIAPTYQSVIEGLSTKKLHSALLGLTATPGRSWANIEDDAKLSDFFGGEKITLSIEGYDDPVSFLMEEGYLARPTFRKIECSNSFKPSKTEAQEIESNIELPEEILNKLIHSEERNYKIITNVEDLLTRHKRIVVFASSVSHASMLAAILVARNHKAQVITGETPKPRRERIIRSFKSNNDQSMVLCNYGVLTTGFDAPKTSAAVIARPTKSLVLYSQMVGRAIRGPKAGGSETAEILTIVDTTLPGFGSVEEAFHNWEDVWNEHGE